MEQAEMARTKGSGPTSTSFKKGESGNPAGRPKLDPELKTFARSYTLEALTTVVQIMQDEKQPASARIRAAEMILDRGHGKAPQVIEPENYDIMTNAELNQRIRESLDEMQTIGIDLKAMGVILVDPEPPDPKKGPKQAH